MTLEKVKTVLTALSERLDSPGFKTVTKLASRIIPEEKIANYVLESLIPEGGERELVMQRLIAYLNAEGKTFIDLLMDREVVQSVITLLDLVDEIKFILKEDYEENG